MILWAKNMSLNTQGIMTILTVQEKGCLRNKIIKTFQCIKGEEQKKIRGVIPVHCCLDSSPLRLPLMTVYSGGWHFSPILSAWHIFWIKVYWTVLTWILINSSLFFMYFPKDNPVDLVKAAEPYAVNFGFIRPPHKSYVFGLVVIQITWYNRKTKTT